MGKRTPKLLCSTPWLSKAYEWWTGEEHSWWLCQGPPDALWTIPEGAQIRLNFFAAPVANSWAVRLRRRQGEIFWSVLGETRASLGLPHDERHVFTIALEQLLSTNLGTFPCTVHVECEIR